MSEPLNALQVKTITALISTKQSTEIEHAAILADLLISRGLVGLSGSGELHIHTETMDQAMALAPRLCSPDVNITEKSDRAYVRRAELKTGSVSREPTAEQRASVARRLAELPELPPYASDRARVERADARARILAETYQDIDGSSPEGYTSLDFGGLL